MMPLATRARSVTHPPEVGGVGVEGGGDGAFERDGSVGVEQLDESTGEDAEVVVALGGGDEQGLGRRGGVVEAVGGAVLAGETLVAFELFDVGGVLDLLAPVEGAAMGGEHGSGVEDAHGLEGRGDDEGASHVVVGDGIVVGIESYVGALGGCDLDALLAGEGVVGELNEVGTLLGEDVGDGALWVFGTGALGGAGVAPLIGLVIEVVEVAEAPRLEKASANKADEPLHPTLLISSRRCDRAWLEAVVSGEFEQRGMEPDGIATAFEHDALHIVVEQDPRCAPQHGKRLDVASDEAGERGVEVEAHEGVARVAQHQDERHQGALGAPDGELSEVRPVDLSLLTRNVRYPDPATDLDDLFLFEAKRRVMKDRTLSLHGRLYEVDAVLVGQTVTLRYDPDAPPSRPIEVVHDGHTAGLATRLDAYANTAVKRHRPSSQLTCDTSPPEPSPSPLAMRNLKEKN